MSGWQKMKLPIALPEDSPLRQFWQQRTPRERVLMTVFGMVVSLTGLYTLLISDQFDQYQLLREQLPTTRLQLEDARAKVKRLPELQVKQNALAERMSNAMLLYPKNLHSGTLALMVGEAARAAQVQVKYFYPQPTVERPGKGAEKIVTEVPVDLLVEGTYEQLSDFWVRLENLQGNVVIRGFAASWETNRVNRPAQATEKQAAKTESNGSGFILGLLDRLISASGIGGGKGTGGATGTASQGGQSTSGTATRIPRAAYQPNVKGPTPTLNVVYKLSFVEVDGGKAPDQVDLDKYARGRNDPFEPQTWDEANPWLLPEGFVLPEENKVPVADGAKPSVAGQPGGPGWPLSDSVTGNFPGWPSLTPNTAQNPAGN
ncbi:type 4a pilus biogenesis protein PilO [Heliophilum fasciatum]|uniref:Type II secretion system (T2SS) protein M n=1 Tax=Heliophilum fasciatum TaxID=35700 RepID=A0A4V2SXS5_9FIRM|nr:type II secretion system protein GspM [Heliophilum fasciatum]MCW2277289.1 Tfp pilus assembly protein PilO [Heliophilum fasciatum]TCP67126.1 type II secretion system (T2SS) protein M [Heliophilum fasciatum]